MQKVLTYWKTISYKTAGKSGIVVEKNRAVRKLLKVNWTD